MLKFFDHSGSLYKNVVLNIHVEKKGYAIVYITNGQIEIYKYRTRFNIPKGYKYLILP